MTWVLAPFWLIKSGVSKAFDFAVKYPWPVFCAILAALSLWLYVDLRDTKADLSAERQAHGDDIKSWQAKVREVEVARDRAATKAREASTNADEYHEQLSQANSGLEQYIRNHRVQNQCSKPVTGAGSSGDPKVPAEPAPVSDVAISEPDLRTCDALYAYSASAYQWANELRQAGLAVDSK